MSGSRVYEFHQREIDDLKTAAVYALAVCTNLKRLLEGIRDNQPHWAVRGIIWFLDPNNKCQSYLDKVDHLIDPVCVPVKVPRRAKVHRGSDGIHFEKKFPLTCEMREEPLAHRAAWVVHDTFRTYLWSVWRRGNPTYIYCDDVGAAADELVESRWQEIRDELEAFVDFDCDRLRRAVEAESKAAMERCRQSIVSDATATLTPGKDKSRYLDITLGDREALRIVDGREDVIEFGNKAKQWDLFKVLFGAGEDGIHRRDLVDQIGGSLDKHKAALLGLIEPLKLDIDLSNGIWTLTSM